MKSNIKFRPLFHLKLKYCKCKSWKVWSKSTKSWLCNIAKEAILFSKHEVQMAWAADSKERSHIWNLTYTLFFLQSSEVIKLRKRTIFKQKLISTKSKKAALNFEASSGRSVIVYSMKKQLILECLQLNTTLYNYVDGIIIIIKIIMIIILTLKSLLKRTWIDRCGSSTAYKQRYMIPRNKRFKPSETLKQTSKIFFTLPYNYYLNFRIIFASAYSKMCVVN